MVVVSPLHPVAPSSGAAQPPRPSLRPKSQPLDFTAAWQEIDAAVGEVLARPDAPPALPIATLNNKCYRLAVGPCTNLPASAAAGTQPGKQQYSVVVHALLQERLRAHLAAHVTPLLAGKTDVAFLSAYVDAWGRYTTALRTLSAIFSYLHNTWRSMSASLLVDTRQVGLAAWVDSVYAHTKEALVSGALAVIKADREGVAADVGLLKAALTSLTRFSPHPKKPLHLYALHFEANYLAHTESYYSQLSASLFANPNDADPIAAVLSQLVKRIKDETARAQLYLDASTMKPLKQVINTTLAEKHIGTFVTSVNEWLVAGRREQLSDLYWMLTRCEGGVDPLCTAVSRCVDEVGRAELAALADEKLDDPSAEFAPAAVRVYNQFHGILVACFENNVKISQALVKGANAFVNRNALCKQSPTAAAMAAAFANGVLREAAGKASLDAAGDAGVLVVVRLLALLDDKDVFQARYAELLSQRLLYSSVCDDAELGVVESLRTVTSHDFTYKWRRMLNDAAKGGEMRELIVNRPASYGDADDDGNDAARAAADAAFDKCEFAPLVLTHGSWPLQPQQDGAAPLVPLSVAAMCGAFDKLYRAGNSMKKLSWLPQYSHGMVRPHSKLFAKLRVYDLLVSSAQAAVLVAFNDAPAGAGGAVAMTAAALAAAVGGDAASVNKAILNLLRLKLFLSADGGYTLNPNFWNKNRKVQVRLVASKDVVKESAEAADAGASSKVQDRKFAVQAAIVRVMKSRRTYGHQQLVADVVAQLAQRIFTPTVQDVKRSIDTLIDKEFLERAADDASTLVYIA
jgi:cullin 1